MCGGRLEPRRRTIVEIAVLLSIISIFSFNIHPVHADQTYNFLWGDDWIPELRFNAYDTYIKFETPPFLYCDKIGYDSLNNTEIWFYNSYMDEGATADWWWISVQGCNITITKWYKRYGQFEFIASGDGAATITLYSITKPDSVYFDEVAQTEGDTWTYDAIAYILTITPTLTLGVTETIKVSYVSAYNPDFVTIIDNAFEYFNITDVIDNIFNVLNTYTAYFTTSISYVQSYIVPVFTLFAKTVTFILDWFSRVVNMFIRVATTVKDILDGTASIKTAWDNVWKYLELKKWQDAIPLFMLISWWASIDDRARRTGAGWMAVFIGDINAIISILSFIYSLTLGVINLVIDLVFRFLSAIPV
jgi:hypothetical protein